MNISRKLWTDETGVILSAETVMLGTIGVLAMTAGVGVMGNAMNEELSDVSQAFRSFDQSFHVSGYQVGSTFDRSTSSPVTAAQDNRKQSALAMKSGSGFQQRPAQEAVRSLSMHPVAAQVVSGDANIVAREAEVTEALDNRSQEQLQAELKELLREYSRLQAEQKNDTTGRPAGTF